MKLSQGIFILLGFALNISAGSVEIKRSDAELIEELSLHRSELQQWFMSGFYGSHPSAPISKSPITCTLCDTAMILVINWFRNGTSYDQIVTNVIDLCITLDIVAVDICEMIVPLYAKPVFFMFEKKPWINRFDVCGVILGGDKAPGCQFGMNNTMTDWVVPMDYNKPPLVEVPLVPDSVPSVKVIHLTDIHPDLHYVEGSLSICDKPLCCRPDPLDDPSNSSIAAGPWGDFLCDFPIESTKNVFIEAATRHPDAEFVMMTGDLVHHQVWNYTNTDNLAHYAAYKRAFDEAFPDTMVYPAIGNHENVPCNMFPPTKVWDTFNMSWVYETQSQMYANNLEPEALVTFRKAGYYTQLHKPGFRIVTLNSNFCYTNNFWIIYDAVDPEGQLAWFAETMDAAEKAGEKVWILGHVPPGSKDCWSKWSHQFVKIINRYEATIQAQFYGHTHNDELRIFFDDLHTPPRPSGSLFIGASVTPYTNLNPGYKIFYADGARENATWEILDHETWVYNLTQANAAGSSVAPVFYKEYSAKEAYDLASFRPADLYEWVQRMATNDTLFLKYYKHWYHDSGREIDDEDCPTSGDISECKMDFLCTIVGTDYTTEHCDRLKLLAKSSV